MNSNDKPGTPSGANDGLQNGDSSRKTPVVTGGPNEEHIISGPGFFERLFGTSPNRPKQTTTPPNPQKASSNGIPTAPASTDSSTLPAVKPEDSTAKPGDAKSGDTTGDTKPEAPKPVFREPDAPLKPHYSRPRAELIFEPEAPTVFITPDAYKRMCLYVELAPKEVGWLGTISQRPDGDFLIEEVFLVEQEVTSVETELSTEGSEKLVLQLLEGGDPGLDKVNKLHFWGHSHVRMGTSPSGTDESTMQRFAREGHEFYVRGIFNKLGRGTFDVYYYKLGFRILDVPWAVIDPATGKTLLDKGRFRSYSYGGGYNSGGFGSAWRGNQADTAEAKPNAKGLPESLVIDDVLRAQVETEYRTKVKERAPTIFKWFSRDKDEPATDADPGANAPVIDGEGIPSGRDIRPGGSPSYPVKPDTSRKSEEGGGFWAWLAGLFESDPNPAPTYTPPPAKPKKKCTPENCQDPIHPWSKGYKGDNATPGQRKEDPKRPPEDRQ